MIFVLDYERNKVESLQEYQITSTVGALSTRKDSLIRFEEATNDLIMNIVGNFQEIINTD